MYHVILSLIQHETGLQRDLNISAVNYIDPTEGPLNTQATITIAVYKYSR